MNAPLRFHEAPVDPAVVLNVGTPNELRIAKSGITYQGKTVADAGELYAALTQALAGKPINLEDSEQYRCQMAAIGTAALGYWKEGDGILPEYDTVPLRDVAKLYAKYEAARSAAVLLGPLYTCIGKGGRYELLGEAKGAGASRETGPITVYRDTETGQLYYRTPGEFAERMAPSEAPAPAGVTRDDVLAMAKERFGWAYGLGGFPHAITAFAKDLLNRAGAAMLTTKQKELIHAAAETLDDLGAPLNAASLREIAGDME